MEKQNQHTFTHTAAEADGLEKATGSLGFQPPAFQLMASNIGAPIQSTSPNPLQLVRDHSHTAPVQRQGINLSSGDKPWDPTDNAKSYQEYNDIAAGEEYVGDVNDKIGTHGLFNCCAIIVAVHIKCGKNHNDNRWVVGMHHFSGKDRRTNPSGNQVLTFEDAYNDLVEATEQKAANLGQEQGTYKVLIPGTASDCHFPAIQALEQKMRTQSHQEAFSNDWQTMFNNYRNKSMEMQNKGNPLRCIAAQVRPGKFKKSNLKIEQLYQPQYTQKEIDYYNK